MKWWGLMALLASSKWRGACSLARSGLCPASISLAGESWRRGLATRLLCAALSTSRGEVNTISDYKRRIGIISQKLANELSRESVRYSQLQASIQRLEEQSSVPSFWNDPNAAQAVLTDLSHKASLVTRIDNWFAESEEIEAYVQLAEEAQSQSYASEASAMLEKLEADIRSFEAEQLLHGPYDSLFCHLSIITGVGGQDAQDWTAMLFRMYQRFAERKKWKVVVLDQSEADVGFKSVDLRIEGVNAYGMLQGEKGTHRLVRVSPFNSLGKRQTSFAAVEVWPVLDDKDVNELDIPEGDLDISTMRSGGPGGQNVNKIETAVRIRHIPSGIVVRCSEERTQGMNKSIALKRLKEKLKAMQHALRVQTIREIKGDAVAATWGQQIRSYVFQPYKLVKDSRTGQESGQVFQVLDGDLDDFVNAYLQANAKGTLRDADGRDDLPS